MTKFPEKVYPPIGHCIYCGATNEKLSKEHIVPFGLAGNWMILPKASCESCARITGEVEQFCLRRMFGSLRNRLDAPTRNKRDRRKVLPLEYVSADGQREHIMIPSTQFPISCVGFRFPAPGLLRGLAPNDAVEGELVVKYIDEEMQKHLQPNKGLKLGTVGVLLFCRMLAKIAHAYAIAEFGENAFIPFLPDLILGKSNTPAYFVGGDVSMPVPETEPIAHHIYRQDCISNGIEYMLVAIRLFAFAGMPRYHVVVGKSSR